jgi:hypothetical protein
MRSENVFIQPEELKSKVNKAINKLFKNDIFLLSANANERSISHKLAEYLQQEFDDWNVDCEYNRDNHDDVKRIKNWKNLCIKNKLKSDDTDAKTVYPDIIIHHRSSKNNLLVIEIKKSNNSNNPKCDIEKIKMFIKDLKYQYGLFLNFKVGEEPGTKSLTWLPSSKFEEGDHD